MSAIAMTPPSVLARMVWSGFGRLVARRRPPPPPEIRAMDDPETQMMIALICSIHL